MKKIALTLTLALAASLAQAGPVDDLVTAAELDDGRTVLALLTRGVDPNAADTRGRTALAMAVREDSRRALDALLASPQLQLDAPNANGETPLMLAAIKGSLPAVQALIKRGAAVNREGWSPLHYAASGPDNGVAAWLLAQGAAVNARSENGTTPLMMAARYGNGEVLPVLLKAGAEPRAANEQELTAADFARLGGRDRVATQLTRLAAERTQADRK